MKPISKILFYAWIIGLATLSGCYYDNEAILYPGSSCTPTVNPAFVVDVMPILNNRCNNCHSGSSPSAGIKLDTYAEVMKSVNNNSLVGSINHQSGYSPMPKNAPKMNSCEIQKIENWIAQGKLNN